MKIVESFELRKRGMVQCLLLIFSLLSLAAFLIALQKGSKSNYWIGVGVLFFGSGYYFYKKHKIIVYQKGIIQVSVGKEKQMDWDEIGFLNYDTFYAGHHIVFQLSIKSHDAKKWFIIDAGGYDKQQIKRLFEILNEQCPNALKNKHFVKMATEEFGWKDKLKML